LFGAKLFHTFAKRSVSGFLGVNSAKWRPKKWACDFNKRFIGNFSKNSLDLNSALLEVSITRHDSKNNLMSIKDNCHLV
jgi:hypothetical protein